jgi:hypothetical protein
MRQIIRTLPAPTSLNEATKPKKIKKASAISTPAAVGSTRSTSSTVSASAATTAASTVATTEFERAKKHFEEALAAGKEPGAFEFRAYKSADVKILLFQDFFDKCAYCESRYATTAPVDVEHYRPKGRVKEEGPAYTGYWWLAMSWDNLLPACIFCNRHNGQVTPTPPDPPMTPGSGPAEIALDESTGKFNSWLLLTTGKGDSFPISKVRLATESVDYASEEALLLDPCRDNPDEHLHFHIDCKAPLGLVLPKALAGAKTVLGHLTPVKRSASAKAIVKHAAATGVSARGAVSIQTFGLNRLQLVRERTRILRRLEFFEQLLIEITKLVVDLAAAPVHPDCKVRNERAVKSLETMKSLITSQLREMTQPSALYSAMVKAWVNDFKSRLLPVAVAGGL